MSRSHNINILCRKPTCNLRLQDNVIEFNYLTYIIYAIICNTICTYNNSNCNMYFYFFQLTIIRRYDYNSVIL